MIIRLRFSCILNHITTSHRVMQTSQCSAVLTMIAVGGGGADVKLTVYGNCGEYGKNITELLLCILSCFLHCKW